MLEVNQVKAGVGRDDLFGRLLGFGRVLVGQGLRGGREICIRWRLGPFVATLGALQRRGVAERHVAVAQARRFFEQRLRVHAERATRFELGDPGAEQLLCVADQLVERGGWLPFHLQPAVEGLFETPCGIAERMQTDHPAAALECMEASANGGERLAVRRIGARLVEVSGNRVEDLVAFFDEDAEQLRIDLGIAGGKQLFGRRRL